jgi:hypothetical protein
VARTTGAVYEFGMGHWSSWMLHLMCVPDRPLISYESDAEWIGKFTGLIDRNHLVRHVLDWEKETSIDYAEGDVAFVDHSPGEERIRTIMRLKGRFKYIVVHDTCADLPGSGGNYGWKHLDGKFKHQVIYKQVRPWTTVYSDVEEFAL